MGKITYPRRFAEEWIRGTLRDPLQHFEKRTIRICPICDYSGYFVSMRMRGRREARCPNCASLERHRQFALILKERAIDLRHSRVLHFAPERIFQALYGDLPDYIMGDVQPKARYGDRLKKLDISAIDFPDASFDYLIAFDVLEHVINDIAAFAEIARVLKPGGQAFLTVPLIYALKTTYRPPADMPIAVRDIICDVDHKRLYGRDFKKYLTDAGLEVEEFCSGPEESLKYGLMYNAIFIGTKK
jgi:SAM-dependent methyltransferase